MPLVRITHPTGVDSRPMNQNMYQALADAFVIPPGDFFRAATEHAPGGIARPRSYDGIHYFDRLMVQITANGGHTVEQKKRLYRPIVDNPERDAGLRTDDVLINLVEVCKENWSIGQSQARYA